MPGRHSAKVVLCRVSHIGTWQRNHIRRVLMPDTRKGWRRVTFAECMWFAECLALSEEWFAECREETLGKETTLEECWPTLGKGWRLVTFAECLWFAECLALSEEWFAECRLCRVPTLCRVFWIWHSANTLPSARQKTLSKACITRQSVGFR